MSLIIQKGLFCCFPAVYRHLTMDHAITSIWYFVLFCSALGKKNKYRFDFSVTLCYITPSQKEIPRYFHGKRVENLTFNGHESTIYPFYIRAKGHCLTGRSQNIEYVYATKLFMSFCNENVNVIIYYSTDDLFLSHVYCIGVCQSAK